MFGIHSKSAGKVNKRVKGYVADLGRGKIKKTPALVLSTVRSTMKADRLMVKVS
jgi:hypothetical protein